MELIEGKRFGEERALYGAKSVRIEQCSFSGDEDGESALKESREVEIENTTFQLRYPLWHTNGAVLVGVSMGESCRAPLWYAEDVNIRTSNIEGPKAVRECRNMHIDSSVVKSAEFGWFCRDISVEQSELSGEYMFLRSKNLVMHHIHLMGKYSFQYCKNVEIRDSILDTKDAFWECENVTVYDSTIRGEYLAWYAKNIRFVNCHIVGTQPFCYCEGLVLENCTMEGCDLAFEYSEVDAVVSGHVDSIKNPLSGSITVNTVGEIIQDENRRDKKGDVKIVVLA